MRGRRDELMQFLLERHISTRRGIMAIHHEVPYRSERWDVSLPETDRVTASGLILPLFHQLTESEQDYIVECLQQFE
jgi:perosamine synthetase